MPNNRFLYYGLLVIVASAAIFAGAEITRRIEYFVPISATIGVIMVVFGLVQEHYKKKPKTSSIQSDATVIPTVPATEHEVSSEDRFKTE